MSHNSIEFKKSNCITLLIILLFLLAGCAATPPQSLDLYDKKLVPETEVAHLLGKKGPIFLLSVNDIDPPSGQTSYGVPRYDLRIPPGPNTLFVNFSFHDERIEHGPGFYYQKYYKVYSIKDISIDFIAQSNHVYELNYEFLYNDSHQEWSPVIIDKTDNQKHTFPNFPLKEKFLRSNYKEKADKFIKKTIDTYF